VDIHEVHDMTSEGGSRFGASRWRFERTTTELDAMARTAQIIIPYRVSLGI